MIEIIIEFFTTLLFEYEDYQNIFSKINVDILSKHEFQDHAINTQKKILLFDFIYNLSIIELNALRKYLDKFLIKRFIVFFFRRRKLRYFLRKSSKRNCDCV